MWQTGMSKQQENRTRAKLKIFNVLGKCGTVCLPHFFFATIRSGFVHVNGCALVGEGGSITARGKLEGGEK